MIVSLQNLIFSKSCILIAMESSKYNDFSMIMSNLVARFHNFQQDSYHLDQIFTKLIEA